MFRKNRPLKDDLMQCICLLAIGLANCLSFLPKSLTKFLDPALIVACVILLLVSLAQDQKRRDMSPEEKRDLERESRDERSLMIRSRAALACKTVEDWLLFALFSLFLLFTDFRRIAYVFYWVLVFRLCLFLAIRWWMNRKY